MSDPFRQTELTIVRNFQSLRQTERLLALGQLFYYHYNYYAPMYINPNTCTPSVHMAPR
jgi:hypothetical protein